MKTYDVEIYIPESSRYSGVSELNSSDAAWKIINNIAVINDGVEVNRVDIKSEIECLDADEHLIYWCEHESGAYAKVGVK